MHFEGPLLVSDDGRECGGARLLGEGAELTRR